MTKIKLCGMSRSCDIAYANALMPEYIGFVFAKNSRRYVSAKEAAALRKLLKKGIVPVGVFVDEHMKLIVDLVDRHIIEVVQLHGREDENYICELRKLTDCTIIKAFQITNKKDVEAANQSSADYVLFDSGGGSGETFDWSLLKLVSRPYFLAGGLSSINVRQVIAEFHPYCVDVSSSLEKDGVKDKDQMTDFVRAVRKKVIRGEDDYE